MANKNIYLVLQQGGSSTEMYVHACETLKEARENIKGCEEGAYHTSAPIPVPAALKKVLLANPKAEQQFYSLLEDCVGQAAQL